DSAHICRKLKREQPTQYGKDGVKMKLLSFRYDGKESFGPKVKKEEAVWDLAAIQEDLGEGKPFPAHIIDGIAAGHEFVEGIRRLVERAETSSNADSYKRAFDTIEWTAPIPRTP